MRLCHCRWDAFYFTVLVHVKALSRDRIVGEGPTTDVLSHPRGECTRAVAGAVTIPDLAIQRARRTQAAVKPVSYTHLTLPTIYSV